jgi:hypothetical protein
MQKQVALLGIIIAIVAVAMSSVGVASAHGGKKGEWDWKSVNAQLVFTGYDTTDIKPLGKTARSTLYDADGPASLDGRFKVQSSFTGILVGQFGDVYSLPSAPTILAGGDLSSTLKIDLDSGLGADGYPDGSCGLPDGSGNIVPCGTEVGTTIGTATLNLGTGTVTGRIVGKLTLTGGLWLGNIPGYPPIHQPLSVVVDANFLITDGTGDFEDARGMLKIKGDVLPSGGGASVTGKVQVPTDD